MKPFKNRFCCRCNYFLEQMSLYYTFNRANSRYNGNDSSDEIKRI